MLWLWYRIWFDVCLETAYSYPVAIFRTPTRLPPQGRVAKIEQMEYG